MDIRLGLVFKDFACWLLDTSCIGLNVAGYTTAEVLKKHGIKTAVFPVRHNVDLVHAINKYNETHRHPLTHVVIAAPWLSVYDMEALISNFKDIQFVVLSHSNVGFLQADPDGVGLLRRYQLLGNRYPNLRVGGNSKIFVDWLSIAYNQPAIWLPNLYPLHNAVPTKVWSGKTPLKIGAFGAVRPYKNFMTAAAASLAIQSEFGIPVEFHMSSGGEEDGGMTFRSIRAMLRNTGVTLVTHSWSYWNNFIKLIESMDLLIQVSYTESFNLITADGVISGVPSVVSSAIKWAPTRWKADSDNVMDVVEVGLQLLCNPCPSYAGIKALERSNAVGLEEWKKFLEA